MEQLAHPMALITLFAIGGGVYVCLFTLFRFHECDSVLAWPTTEGEIIKSTLRGPADSSKDRPDSLRYRIDIHYSYKVGKKRYIGRRQELTKRSPAFSSREHAERELRHKYAVGTSVEVFYNPRKPKSSVLSTSVDKRVLQMMFFGGFALIDFAAGLFCGVYAGKDTQLASLSYPLLLTALAASGAFVYLALKPPEAQLAGGADK